MARPLNKKSIEKRIKDNLLVMRISKKFLMNSIKDLENGKEVSNMSLVRKSLASFIECALAVTSDKAKINLIKGK